MEKDVVVIGSGGAGLAAALTAALHGLDVLVVEKTEYFGGATALSGGGTWIPGNGIAARAGLSDSREEALAYIHAVVGPQARADLITAFLDAGPEMLDFLSARTELAYKLGLFSADFYPELAGAKLEGRMLAPMIYDGRRLGDYFAKLRAPLAEFNAPATMMIDLEDVPHLMAPTQSLESSLHVLRMVGRVIVDRARHGRGTRLTMGNALVARLLRSVLDQGVELWSGSAMSRLIRQGDRIAQVEIMRGGQPITIAVRRGVVLATGGFSANPAMLKEYIPHADQHITLMPPGNTGDGISAALAVGAAMEHGNTHNASWIIASHYPLPNGERRKWPHLFMDRPKPGFMIVDQRGARIGNEAALDFAAAMHRADAVPAHLVCDARALRKYGLGPVRPGGWGRKRLVRAGYLVEAPLLRALAAKINVDADGLEATAAKMTRYAQNGIDPDFGKGGNAFDRQLGDPGHQPNPCLGPVATAPFYAAQVNPGDASTTVGLRIDSRARVLDAADEPIGGLYASGLDMNSLWRGVAPANGANNSLALTFGFIAGRELANAAPRT